MDDDREQELERRVDELEATVHGLTEELVDLSERIRHLEDDTDVDTQPDHTASLPDTDDTDDVADDIDEDELTEEAAQDTDGDSDDADDIIVA